MKVSKIPGLGRFGVFIDDLDFTNLTDDEWHELGQQHLNNLVTIIRNVSLTPSEYESWASKWITERNISAYRLLKKYNANSLSEIFFQKDTSKLDQEDKDWFNSVSNILAREEVGKETNMLRVTGMKDKQGNALGMFADGELLWHSNESGSLIFAPAVSLLGFRGVVGSATGFLTTPDWYEEQTESFRSELDEMVICHKFTAGKINPGLRKEQDLIMYKNMCPEDAEIPLVIQSPIGIKGLHYSINTIDSIKGMSKEESNKVFEYINKTLFVDKYIYDHWYSQDNDICFFDNSITLHRRLGGISNRLCYRIQGDYEKITPKILNPYFQEPFISKYEDNLSELKLLLRN
ncbi:TauD/TfdA-like domain containing protein [uncultured Caudovirales phage]|uniref:TauD/TfdA-like domain containing protein n=1 Tax=uncultured Caudovirales phage TaxID=2100421 RepID=A0A6J5LJU5_9CAUD|nr:TauD/TfdA-like domain containing protein [uncultured Caudovirales phage]